VKRTGFLALQAAILRRKFDCMGAILLRRSVLAATACVLVGTSSASAVTKQDLADCDNPRDFAVRVAGCTRALESKKWPPKMLHILYLQRAQGYGRLKQYERGVQDYTSALKHNPRSAQALGDRGDAYNGLGDYDRALKDADDAIRIDPTNGYAYNTRGVVLVQKGDFDPAIAALSQGIGQNPKLGALYTNRANAWKHKGEFDRAITDLDSALKLEPENALAYANRCNIWQSKEELEKALSDCDDAIRRDPSYPSAYVNRGTVFFKKGELDPALKDFGQAIRLDPSNAGAYTGRGDVWRKKLQFERAISDYEQAIKLNPKLAASHTSKGLIYEANGEIEQAREAFRTAVKLPTVIGVFGIGGSYTQSSQEEQDTARARLAALGDAGPVAPGPLFTPANSANPAPSSPGRRIALVVGNGAYVSAPALVNPPNDARLIAKNLRDIKFDVSEGINLDRQNMERLIGDFLRAAATADVAVLFYAGHGVQIDGQNYLLPIDVKTDVADFRSDLMDVGTILAGLDDRLRANIVVLDACRDNPMAKTAAQAETGRSISVRSGLASPTTVGKGATSGAGTLLAFATAPGQVALDGEGSNSPFSTALARHINTPGLEVQQMLTRVRADVVASTKSKQVPWSNSSLLGEIFLAGRP
jgi:tetratricopeptide (TPR) repeat protein